MMPAWVIALLVVGANFTVWGTVGMLRLLDERVFARGGPALAPSSGDAAAWAAGGPAPSTRLGVGDVAVLIAAHNEETVIGDSLRAIARLVPAANIHVVSDGSTDRTVELAGGVGVNVIETATNVGKAGALQEAIRRFGLVKRFRAVLLLDADTQIDPRYLTAALPLFDDPAVVAVAGCVRTDVAASGLSPVGKVLICHRARIYAVTQRLMKFGQTWRRSNATPIVPGFASMYRTEALPWIEVNPPGLVIEDFNMTFEVYRKRLGKVGFTLRAVAVTQDPDNLRDYVRQTKRWSLGLWQTVRRHPPRPSLFGGMLSLLLLELVTSSAMLVMLPLVLLVLLAPHLDPGVLGWPGVGPLCAAVSTRMNFRTVLLGVAVPDLSLTCLAALVERRVRFLYCGLFFLVLRILDAGIALYTLPLAMFARSTGRWTSPARRGGTQVEVGTGAPVSTAVPVGTAAGVNGAAGVSGAGTQRPSPRPREVAAVAAVGGAARDGRRQQPSPRPRAAAGVAVAVPPGDNGCREQPPPAGSARPAC